MDIQAFGDENMIGGDDIIVEIDESKFTVLKAKIPSWPSSRRSMGRWRPRTD